MDAQPVADVGTLVEAMRSMADIIATAASVFFGAMTLIGGAIAWVWVSGYKVRRDMKNDAKADVDETASHLRELATAHQTTVLAKLDAMDDRLSTIDEDLRDHRSDTKASTARIHQRMDEIVAGVSATKERLAHVEGKVSGGGDD